ncbi:MAG TPA: response regulator [Oscillatoriaceae cyanobacterium M33_DOE_052]|uniref:histidine kinase n=1 Tax=Planktothricoides sp. SpSt-374 TaxID=2282167 RepID=A0A7C3ZJW6_9CYAN|nr:response regulator [Oscillatoriaceae cyanobacterium M33_DOE_052]
MNLKRILVVEDEIIVAEDIAFRLRRLGYTVSGIVFQGEDAIQHCQANHPDLVLMDIVLKGTVDGIEAAQTIRDTLKIPIVFLTAYADDKTLKKAVVTEPFGYILKPFKEKDLHTTIEIALHRHQVESKINQALENSENLRKMSQNQEKIQNQYVSMAAHELRRPLATILLSADSLQFNRERWNEETKLKYLNWIQSAAENMNQLIEDMLLIGRIEAGKFQLKPTAVDLNYFCRRLIEQVQEKPPDLIYEQGIKPQVTLIAEEPDMVAVLDRQLLQIILSNLLSNALKYSPEGGAVMLELSLKDIVGPEQLAVGAHSGALEEKLSSTSIPLQFFVSEKSDCGGGNTTDSSASELKDVQSIGGGFFPPTGSDRALVFRVRDQGIGIPEEDRQKLFEMFYRCGNVGKIPGNGLGLAIVKQAVDLLSGSIGLESHVGEGTTFTVVLPYIPGEME